MDENKPIIFISHAAAELSHVKEGMITYPKKAGGNDSLSKAAAMKHALPVMTRKANQRKNGTKHIYPFNH